MYALTNDQLRKYAPSVFATSPWNAVSDRYRFIVKAVLGLPVKVISPSTS
jgi:hypothetical protein